VQAVALAAAYRSALTHRVPLRIAEILEGLFDTSALLLPHGADYRCAQLLDLLR
jgi:hypothetical protein